MKAKRIKLKSYITTERAEKPDSSSWMEDVNGELQTFAFSGPCIDSTRTLKKEAQE
jgi:hypothetical protein